MESVYELCSIFSITTTHHVMQCSEGNPGAAYFRYRLVITSFRVLIRGNWEVSLAYPEVRVHRWRPVIACVFVGIQFQNDWAIRSWVIRPHGPFAVQ